jgi:hypothetical protein
MICWDYEPNPVLVLFRIFVARRSGAYHAHDPYAEILAIPTLVTEASCETFVPFAQGRYYAVIAAVGTRPVGREATDVRDIEIVSPYSDELCLERINGQIYGCVGEPIVASCETRSAAMASTP